MPAVAGGQLTYSSAISRESAHMVFLLAALNGVDIVAADY